MKLKTVWLFPCAVFAFMAMFFVGSSISTTSVKEVKAATTTLYLASNSDCSFYYNSTYYDYPDYCSQVLIVVKTVSGTVMASNVINLSGELSSSNPFSIEAEFVSGTYYKIEAQIPTYATLQFTELNNKSYGYFQYTANKTLNFTYSVSSEKWFSQMASL